MQLGNFSVSLSVSDLAKSRDFYQILGFTVLGGNPDEGWVIMRNGRCTIGLFQGMIEQNMLTFNPGWDAEGRQMTNFLDVREIQRRLKAAGLKPQVEVDDKGRGPASFVVVDPDGNPVLIDQHV
ncbi:MAG: VOC family protein [Rhodobacteraceae bacterium]|nr:VOC family protein [Paracoccaceae bacterium]